MHFLQRSKLILLFCLAAIGCAATAPVEHPTTAPSTYREADEIKSSLTYLASDQLEGRGLETEGIFKAADYIATQFRKDGLQTLPGMNGYFQDFPITLSTDVGDKTTLSVNDQSLKLKSDFTALGMSAEKSFSGPLAFVGYAISNPDKNYDDFTGIDVKGKVALALRFEPTDLKGKSKFTGAGYSEHATFATKAKAAADHGAVALIVVDPAPGETHLMNIAATGNDKAAIPVLQVSRDAAASLLQQAGRSDISKLRGEINSQLKPQSFDVSNTTVTGNVEITRTRKTFHNVLAYLPGKGPRQDEFIVVGAHYDHLGRGEIGSLAHNSHQIHHGADDNASGTSAVLELAEEMSRHGALDRSILFACFSGEERGLLGSMHFVSHPPVPLDHIVAMVNMDMVGRVQNNAIFVGGNGTAKDFDEVLAKTDEHSPLVMKNAGTDVGGRGGIGPSDHMSFAMKKIPVIFLWSGMHRDYHRPTDTADKINFLGVAEVVDFVEDLIGELSDMPREQYVDKYDHSGNTMGGIKVRLGIMPDYTQDADVVGVRIAGTSPDAPAAKAGLREGDVITAIDSDKITSLGDYMTALGKHRPGDVVKITVDRDKQRVELSATLADPKG
jgi:Zn-dependent M28 family amino/carboxypeptidase